MIQKVLWKQECTDIKEVKKMKVKFDKKLGVDILQPESVLEAVEHLEEFFKVDMWYAKHSEWKTEKNMLKYLTTHFNICKKDIKRLTK